MVIFYAFELAKDETFLCKSNQSLIRNQLNGNMQDTFENNYILSVRVARNEAFLEKSPSPKLLNTVIVHQHVGSVVKFINFR